MEIRVTKKSIIATFVEFSVASKDRNQFRVGPADVHYSLDDFKISAKHYGWGDIAPTDAAPGTGLNNVFEVLYSSLTPTKVCWL